MKVLVWTHSKKQTYNEGNQEKISQEVFLSLVESMCGIISDL